MGSPTDTVTGVMCAVDPTCDAVEAAAATKCDLLLVHHPQLFARGRGSLDSSTPGGRVASKAIREGVGIVACYQNADVADGGASDLMAAAAGLRRAVPLVPSRSCYVAKVVVFVTITAPLSVIGPPAVTFR